MRMRDITDLEFLKNEIVENNSVDDVATNNLYAHMWHLKNYSGLDQNTFINAVVEHGYASWDELYAVEVMHNAPVYLTCNETRKNILRKKTGAEAISIGPYIEYVEGLYSNQGIEMLKKRNGKTLLVFPAHGTPAFKASYDFDSFCEIVKDIGKDFNTVLVSLMQSDIQAGWAKKYKELGYVVVSCGDRKNKYFLRRHKSILALSDAVITNCFSTGIINALYLKKPIYTYQQKISYSACNNIYSLVGNEHVEWTWSELVDISSDSSFGNLSQQRMWASDRYSFGEVKTRQEMHDILCFYSRK